MYHHSPLLFCSFCSKYSLCSLQKPVRHRFKQNQKGIAGTHTPCSAISMCDMSDLYPYSTIGAQSVSEACMFVALACYFSLCICVAALLSDGSAHERRQSATRTVLQEAREAATEREAALARVSLQRAPTKSCEQMAANTCDAPPRPMSFKEPAPRPPMIRRSESARPLNTSAPRPPMIRRSESARPLNFSESSTRNRQMLMQWKSEPSLHLLGASEHSASKTPRPRPAAKPQRADGRHGALSRSLSGNGSATRPFVSSSARFYAEVVSRQQAALLGAVSKQPATLAKELPTRVLWTTRR